MVAFQPFGNSWSYRFQEALGNRFISAQKYTKSMGYLFLDKYSTVLFKRQTYNISVKRCPFIFPPKMCKLIGTGVKKKTLQISTQS